MADPKEPFSVTIPALGVKVEHVDGVNFACHVCGLPVWSGTEENGRGSIAHREPMCNKFRDMDPLAFLTEARKHYENRN